MIMVKITERVEFTILVSKKEFDGIYSAFVSNRPVGFDYVNGSYLIVALNQSIPYDTKPLFELHLDLIKQNPRENSTSLSFKFPYPY